MFKILDMMRHQYLPVVCGNEKIAQKIANLLAQEEKKVFLVQVVEDIPSAEKIISTNDLTIN